MNNTVRKIALIVNGTSGRIRRMALGVLAVAGELAFSINDFHLMETGTAPTAADRRTMERIRQWNPDGMLCLLEPRGMEALRRDFENLPPIVNMTTSLPMRGVAVVKEERAGFFRLAAQHLRERGYRSLACLDLGDPRLHPESNAIFREVVHPPHAGNSCLAPGIDPAVVQNPYAPVAPVPAKLTAWLRKLPKPTGIICPFPSGGNYLIRVCRELGLKVPEDIAVLGSDDADIAMASRPTLSTVFVDAQEIGSQAAQLLHDLMEGNPPPAGDRTVGAMNLIIRESTALKKVEVCDMAAAGEFIERHACSGLTAAQLIAATQRVSSKTFYTHFRAATGRTPADAILERRLREARRLLSATAIPIHAVANACGFPDSSNFTRTFRAIEKITPSAYRLRTFSNTKTPGNSPVRGHAADGMAS